MAPRSESSPLRIQLSEERRRFLAEEIQRLFHSEFEHDLSDFQARRLLEFLVHRIGAPIYNQAIQDARGFLQAKLEDLDVEFYEPEDTDDSGR